jgi:predicted HTH domain antitoxin
MYLSGDMTLTIPAERLGNVVVNERDAVVDVAIGLYKRQLISLGRAAEVAGLASADFLSELGRRRIPINYDVDELREDVTTLKNLT